VKSNNNFKNTLYNTSNLLAANIEFVVLASSSMELNNFIMNSCLEKAFDQNNNRFID
jgi:hypothetical protein